MKLINAAETAKKISKAFGIPMHDLVDVFAEIPQVDAQPVEHSEWIPIEYDSYADGNPVWDVWKCKKCEHEHYGEYNSLTSYCPDCGCRMDD